MREREVTVLVESGPSADFPRFSGTQLASKPPECAPLGDLLHFHATETPDATALLSNEGRMSYRELDRSSNALAGWLLEEQGLRPGDRVAIHWPNSIEAVEIFFGIFKAGLIAVPLNLRLKPPEVAWILEHSQSMLCFSAPSFASIAEEARSRCAGVPGIISELPGICIQSTMRRGRNDRPLPPVHESEPAAILYTSGSTARPKGVTHTHGTLRAGARFVAEYLLDPQDTVLTMTPLMHVAGLGVALLAAIHRGIAAAMLPAFDPGLALDMIERFRCTFTFTLPALMHVVVEEQARKPRDVSSLRTVLVGGDCVPVRLQERFAELFPLHIQEGIGMTETYPIAVNPKRAIRPGALGIPLPGIELRIADASGQWLDCGEIGEIVVRSPSNCMGYWNDPGATQALLRDGWLHTGDLASRDSDGYFWFKGRAKEIIIHGGSNISPQEVEEALYHHPDVSEAGVIGAPDTIYGEAVVAFVTMRNGATVTERELREHARIRVADYKVPERIFFISEMPKGTTGKVHRSALKARLATERGGSSICL